jgi:hypothetical protein
MAQYVGDIVVPFPHHGGTIPQVLWITAHTLECEAIPGLGEDLARGYFQNESVSVHTVSDPRRNVAGLLTNVQGYHAGATANKYGLADEVTGRAAWTRAKWLEPNPRAALEQQWIAMAALGVAAGFGPGDFRWLSQAEITSKAVRGYVYHADLSLAIRESSHWDPGTGYPGDIGMSTIRWYAGVADHWGLDAGTRPDGLGGAPATGGAEPAWFPEVSVAQWLGAFADALA